MDNGKGEKKAKEKIYTPPTLPMSRAPWPRVEKITTIIFPGWTEDAAVKAESRRKKRGKKI